MKTLRVDLLGSVRVERSGSTVAVTSSRQAALLGALALCIPQLVPVDAIIAAVWGQHAPGRPEQAVQQYVSSLRSLLEPNRSPRQPATLLLTEPTGYRLADTTTDVGEFRRSVQLGEQLANDRQWRASLAACEGALALWRGPALAGMPDTELFNEDRRSLDSTRLAVRERRLQVMLELGMTSDVVVDAEALVAVFPTREKVWASLILALHTSGRTVEAFAAYDRVRQVLDDELAAPPGVELRSPYARLLQRDPTLIDGTTPGSPELALTFRVDDQGALPWLEFTDGQQIVLGVGVITLGRRSTHTVVLTDNRISRDHAELRHVDGRVTIRDCGSSNGTFVNGSRVLAGTPQELVPGDVIGLGNLTLRFHHTV